MKGANPMLPLLKNNILETSAKCITLVPLADIHFGAQHSNEALFKEAITYIAKTKNCYAVGLGDWIDLVTYHSKGLVGEQKYKSTEQYMKIVKLLMPIRHKILFALTGNHESRATKCGTPDVMAQICDKLEIPYQGIDYHFAIKFKDRIIVYCYAGHGSGGGATAGAKINRLHHMHNQSPFADIIFAGHTHSLSSDIKPIPFLTRYGKLTYKLQYLISCGSMLESTEGYAKAAFYAPQSTGFKILKISTKRGPDNLDKVKITEILITGKHE